MNNTGKIQLIEESFLPQNAAACDLLLKITDTSLSYAVINNQQKQLKVLSYSSFNQAENNSLSTTLEQDHLLKSEFETIKVAVETFAFTFIPDKLYSQNDLEKYTRFISKPDNSEFFTTDINRARIKNIAAIKNEQRDLLKNYFPDFRLFTQANPIIEAGFEVYKNSGTQLILQFNAKSFEAVILKDKKVAFYNIYSIENTDDINYFLLLIFQQLKLNPEEADLIVAGEIEMADQRHKCLLKYFPHIKFAEVQSFINPNELFDQFSQSRFFSLLALQLCE